MKFSTYIPASKRVRGGTGALLAAILGLVAMVALVSCGPFAGGFGNVSAERTEESTQQREASPRTGVLIRTFSPRYETSISLPQYRQADEYMRMIAPAEMRMPLLLSTRYAQTEHMPILLKGNAGNQSSRQFTDWGFLAFAQDFNAHIRILEGRPAEPAMASDTFVEAIMTSEKLVKIGANVGDSLILIHRTPGGDLEPIEVKVVGRWSPADPDEMYWFYDAGYFSEALMVAEGTYVDVLLPGWREIGYEYSWYAVYDVTESDESSIDSGIIQIQANLAGIVGKVEIHVMQLDNEPQGEDRSNSQ